MLTLGRAGSCCCGSLSSGGGERASLGGSSPAARQGLQGPGAVLHGLVALDMWGLPRPGLEPASPALAGGCFATEPPGSLASGVFEDLSPLLASTVIPLWSRTFYIS